MKKFKSLLIIPVVIACIIYIMLAFIFASFDVSKYPVEGKLFACGLWLVGAVWGVFFYEASK